MSIEMSEIEKEMNELLKPYSIYLNSLLIVTFEFKPEDLEVDNFYIEMMGLN